MPHLSDWLVVSDVDETALVASQGIPPQNVEAVARFTAAGGHFTFATGRSLSMLRLASDHFAVNAPLIALNGSLICGTNGQILARHPLPAAVREAAAEICRRYDGKAAVYAVGERAYHAIAHAPESLAIARRAKTIAPHICTLDEVEEDLFKILVRTATPADADEARALLGARYGDTYEVVRSGPDIVEVMERGVDKGSALLEVAAMLGISRENTVAIGDSENDIAMLRAAGRSAAPAGADPEVLKTAGQVLCPCMQGALAALIEELMNAYQ